MQDEVSGIMLSDQPLTDGFRKPLPMRRIELRRQTAMLERTWELETFYDLTVLFSEHLVSGKLSQDAFPDARSRMDIVIDWANEFNRIHAWTDWGEVEYLDLIASWFKTQSENFVGSDFQASQPSKGGVSYDKKELDS